MLRSMTRAPGWLVLSWLLSSCATPTTLGPGDAESLDAAYAAAVEAARVPTPQAISRDLVPIVRWNDALRWDDDARVLMATFTKETYYADPTRFSPGRSFPLHGDTWFTAVPMMQRFCAGTGLEGDALRLRIAQRLGLPPDSTNDSILEVWVDPGDLFRPCPDPAITDRECQVEIPGTSLGASSACDVDSPQVSGAFVEVHRSHLRWMCEWRSESAYGAGQRYPWTALGYTYDWGRPDSPVGESEFVAPRATSVVFESIAPLDRYCSDG